MLIYSLHILSRSQNQIFIKLIKMFEVKSFQYLIDHTKLQGTPFVNVIFNYKKVISINIHIYLFNLHSENRYIVSFIIWDIRKWSFKIWLLSYRTPYAKKKIEANPWLFIGRQSNYFFETISISNLSFMNTNCKFRFNHMGW